MKTKIIFWVSTTILFIMEGVLPAFTGHSEMSIAGITGLGYPLYFVTLLVTFKVLGAIVLMVPAFPARLKEWAYAGFMFNFISALVSMWVVTGLNAMLLMPVAFMVILVASYLSFHKLRSGVRRA